MPENKRYKYIVTYPDNTYTVFYDDEVLSHRLIKKVVCGRKIMQYVMIDMLKETT